MAFYLAIFPFSSTDMISSYQAGDYPIVGRHNLMQLDTYCANRYLCNSILGGGKCFYATDVCLRLTLYLGGVGNETPLRGEFL